MKSRAAILTEMSKPMPYAQSQPLQIDTVHLLKPDNNELLIEIKSAGLCHSDLSTINGTRPRPLPMVLGHEAAGIVREVGPNVKNFSPDEHVVMVFVPACGSCLHCATGAPALCNDAALSNNNGTLLSGQRKILWHNNPIFHHVGLSVFSEYVVVSEKSVVKIPKDIPFEQAALFGCAVITGAGALFNVAKPPPACSIAVVGLGGVGMCALLAALSTSPSLTIAVDVVPDKLDFATHSLNSHLSFNSSHEHSLQNILDASNGGLDFVIEAAGSPKALEFAFNITKKGGTTISVSLPHHQNSLSINHLSLVAQEKTIKGSYLGSCVPLRDIPKYISLFQQGHFPVDKLISEVIPLEQINHGFDLLHNAQTIRQIISF